MNFEEGGFAYRGRQAGDRVILLVEREEQEKLVSFTLVEPPLGEVLARLIPVIVALVFWIAGVAVLTFNPADQSGYLFFLFCLVGSLVLSAGSISSAGPSWTSSLFRGLLWLVGPLMVHFHRYFPQPDAAPRRRYGVAALYALAVAGALPYLLYDRTELGAMPWSSQLFLAGLLFLAAGLLIVVWMLTHTYRNADSAQVRGKIRIVLLGGVVGLLPTATLTLLPAALFEQPIIPFDFSFLLLAVIPLTYGYAIVRHRLIEIEKHVNRGATQVLVFSLIGAFYLILSAGLDTLLPAGVFDQTVTNTVLVLFLAVLFTPLRKRVQMVVDKAFYGGWYDYRSAVTRINQGLEQITDLRLLANAICERTLKTLRLENVYLFLTGPKGDLSIFETYGYEEIVYRQAASFPILPVDSAILRHLQDSGGPVESGVLQKYMKERPITPEDRQMLECDQIRLWVPIFGRKQISGVLALGPKLGGDVFSVDDLYILGVIARQIGPLIENIHLLTRLRQHARDLENRVDERTAELHDAKERVEAILSSVADGVIVTDLTGKIVRVNDAFQKQSHYEVRDLIGMELFELFVDQNDPAGLKQMQHALRSGEVWSGDLISERKNGRAYDVHLTVAPIRDQNGRMVGYVGSQRDITQQRELDRLKDQFISDVSHELRTPVTNLTLFIGLLERSAAEKRHEYLEIIKSETKQVADLIEDILDLSRLERKRLKPAELSMIDLNAVSEQVVKAHRLLAQTSGVNLRFEPCADLPKIEGDEGQLVRVVTNLVTNAVRYTPEGSVCVRTVRQDGQIGLQVEDDGMGIDDEDFPHLFERFYRGRRVSQSKIPGTGLGLAIVKEIVEIHEGRIEVESEVDCGSTFSVWFPIQEMVAWPERPS